MSSFASPSAISYDAARALPRLPTPSPILCGTLLEAPLHLASKVGFSVRKTRDHRADTLVELQGASVDVEFVKIVRARSFHGLVLPRSSYALVIGRRRARRRRPSTVSRFA